MKLERIGATTHGMNEAYWFAQRRPQLGAYAPVRELAEVQHGDAVAARHALAMALSRFIGIDGA